MLTGEKGKRQNDEKNTIFHDLNIKDVTNWCKDLEYYFSILQILF